MSKKQNPQTDISKELAKIYTDDHGTPDLTTLEPVKKSRMSRLLRWALMFLGLASLSAWAGYYLLSGNPIFSSSHVTLAIEAPFSLSSGQRINYRFVIANKELTPLERGTLTITLPHEVTFLESSIPAQQEKNLFDSGVSRTYTFTTPIIDPKNTYIVTVSGQLIGELTTTPTLQARYTYSPTNHSSTFTLEKTFSTEIKESAIILTSQYQNQVSKITSQDLTFTLTNSSELELSHLSFGIETPATFENQTITTSPVYESAPEDTLFEELSEENVTLWKEDQRILVPSLPPNNSIQIKLTGVYSKDAQDQESITPSVYLAANEELILQVQETIEQQLLSSELITTLIVNGSTENGTVNFNEQLSYLLRVQNKSSAALGDVEVRLVLDSSALNWDTLSDQYKGTTTKNHIQWTSEQIPQLKVMLPEDEVEIPLTIETHSLETLTGNPSTAKVTSFFDVSVGFIDNVSVIQSQSSQTLTHEFNSNAAVTARARYFDDQGNSVGLGPLPPKVGQATTYQVVWTLSNSLHELQDITLEAQLPESVQWAFDAQSDAGTITHDNGTIRWTVNKMPTSVKTLTATFKVTLTPETKNLNTIMTLLNQTTASMRDATTKGGITLATQPLTTNTSGDNGLIKE